MDHRYGRHGPRAWLRWYERHSVHHSLDLVPVAQVVVIHVHLPIHVERFMFIVTNPLPLSHPSKDEDAIVFLAKRTASRRAKEDIAEDTIAANGEIDQLAQSAWELIDDEKIINQKGNRTFDEVELLYHNTYVETYLLILDQENVHLADKTLRTIRRIAYRDHEQDGNTVLNEYLPIQAAIRVYPHAQCNPLERPAYLEEVARLIQIYIEQYYAYPGRDGRSSRSNTFPSESRP